jgi:predicted O-methyltransferase YrrM
MILVGEGKRVKLYWKDTKKSEILDTAEIPLLISLGQKYLWQGSHFKAQIEASGIQLIKGDFYSPVPTVKEIETSWELQDRAMPYLESELYDNDFLLGFLIGCLMPYTKDFNPPITETNNPAEFFWQNSQFSYSDALSYYCLIRHLNPKFVIEVGSGYSSLVALQALRDNGLGELILVEPYPSDRLKGALKLRLLSSKPTLIQKPVQDVPVSFFVDQLNQNDILFIDSTHTVKAGGDCIYLYLKILPNLKPGVVIHAHDIFLPQMMPAQWLKELHLYWTEQYLLQAYLLDNPRVKVLFGSHYHKLLNRSALEAFMAGKSEAGGGSFWFQKM